MDCHIWQSISPVVRIGDIDKSASPPVFTSLLTNRVLFVWLYPAALACSVYRPDTPVNVYWPWALDKVEYCPILMWAPWIFNWLSVASVTSPLTVKYCGKQACVLQAAGSISVDSPLQVFPPCWGGGLVQVRLRDLFPPPQVLSQSVHAVHAV